MVTLPVQYRGGALIIRDAEGSEERFFGGGQPGQVEWTAFLAECEYEVETVQQGCRMSISFAVHLKTYGPSVDPLITPSEHFLDLVSPVLSLSRGRKVAFYLTHDYGVNPADVLAESMVPHVRLVPTSRACPLAWVGVCGVIGERARALTTYRAISS